MSSNQDQEFLQATNFDNSHVDVFAKKMKAKLELTRLRGRWGWASAHTSQESLSNSLYEAINKGDPIDIANYCMFLEQRGQQVLPKPDIGKQVTVAPLNNVDVRQLQEQADAWEAVVDALKKVVPDFFSLPYNGMECAVKTIEELDVRNKKLEGELNVTHQNYSGWLSNAGAEILSLKNNIAHLKDALRQEQAKNYMIGKVEVKSRLK